RRQPGGSDGDTAEAATSPGESGRARLHGRGVPYQSREQRPFRARSSSAVQSLLDGEGDGRAKPVPSERHAARRQFYPNARRSAHFSARPHLGGKLPGEGSQGPATASDRSGAHDASVDEPRFRSLGLTAPRPDSQLHLRSIDALSRSNLPWLMLSDVGCGKPERTSAASSPLTSFLVALLSARRSSQSATVQLLMKSVASTSVMTTNTTQIA